MAFRLPGSRPDVAARPDEVLDHLELLFRRELHEGRGLGHQAGEGRVKAFGIDAGRPVTTLVGTGASLAEDDLPLER